MSISSQKARKRSRMFAAVTGFRPNSSTKSSLGGWRGPRARWSRERSTVLRAPVVRKLREDAPNAPARIRLIAGVAWDQVDVQVHDGLADCFSNVYAEVESIRVVPSDEVASGISKRLPDLGDLVGVRVVQVREVPLGDDQGMPRGD
jgi:hypothetical protein